MKWIFMTALLAAGSSAAAAETDPGPWHDRMTQGKLAADLGKHEAAAQAFAELAETGDAPPALRAEALIRLGSEKRAAGDYEGAIKAFDLAWKRTVENNDRDTLALLVVTLGEALPGAERWEKIWTRVPLVVDRSDPARPVLTVQWPDVPAREKGRVYTGHPITLDFKDANLQDVFRMFADITGTNVVVHPGVGGKITIRIVNMPWDEALVRILASNGLGFRVDGNVLRIARPEQLGTSRRGAGPKAPIRYTGQPIALDLKDADLVGALARITEVGGATTRFDPRIRGRVTIKLNAVPWDQAFDVIMGTNGLEWTRDKNVFTALVPRKPGVTTPPEGPLAAPAPGPPLSDHTADQLALKGIITRDKNVFVAVLEGPDRKTYAARVATRVRDAAITALDATTLTFRQDDGRALRKTLYPPR